MKILFVPKEFPHSKVIGGPIIIFNRIKYLSRNHQVGLASFIREEDRKHLSSIEPFLWDLELMPYPKPRNPFRKFWDFFFSEVPPYMCNTKSPEMRDTVAMMTRRGDYDVVIAEYSVMGQYLHRNPGINSHTRRVISCHECYTTARKKVKDFYGALSKQGFHAMLNLYRLERFEFAMYKGVDRVLTLTTEEKEGLLQYAPKLDIDVIPHGVDTEYFVPITEQDQEIAVGFLGNYPHDPNRDAVMYFLIDMWPHIKKKIPGVKFYVIGRGPTEDIRSRAQKDPDIVVTGEVDDVRKYLKMVRVFIAPIRLGKGFRGKILEAMAMGIPVITTRLGAEGIPVGEGENIMLAETPDEFIQKTHTLLNDSRLYDKISINARNLVVDMFSWQKGAALLGEKLQKLVEGS